MSDSGQPTLLEQRLLATPAGRARFLAETLEILQRNGVDTSAPALQPHMASMLDIRDSGRFMGALQATSVLTIAVSSGAQQKLGATDSGEAQIATGVQPNSVALTGSRDHGQQESLQAGSAMQPAVTAWVPRGAGAGRAGPGVVSGIGNVATLLTIVMGGQRGGISNVARVVADVVISGRATQPQAGLQESLAVPRRVPSAAALLEVALGLRALAELLVTEAEALEEQLTALARGQA